MKKIAVLILISLASISCLDSQIKKESKLKKGIESSVSKVSNIIPDHQKTFDSIASGLNFTPQTNYTKTKQEIVTARKLFKKQYQKEQDITKKTMILDSAAQYFTTSLVNNIIPYWYGTEWDFNGHTNIPNQGEIACGYFVSTTLKHMGVALNRYKMAQQASKLEVESVAIKQNNVIFSMDKNISKELSKLQDGVYIVGLDNHVGYIYKHDTTSYFINSSYITDRVMIELPEHSDAFQSNVYYLAPVTNREFVKKWMLEEIVRINT